MISNETKQHTRNIISNIITYTEEKERYAKSQQDATKYVEEDLIMKEITSKLTTGSCKKLSLSQIYFN